jgi:hypothetical protein
MSNWPSIFASTTLDNGDVMYYGRCLMSIYPGSEHVRGAEFRVPALAGTQPTPGEGQPAPVVNATVYTLDNNVGTMFAIYNINHNILGAESQIVVSASNTNLGQKVDNDFYCSVVIIGTPSPIQATAK